ncbi:hypothetical protein MLIT_42070 [Mycolicibacterium litorale]|uniref:DUF559 domain-containing protein n=1 Tax=Mycolicibacterium litorale TaxID=758802 RepID=A0AAD1MVC4_9MYCO|nr:hypothetical protein MLIT_42070 [Mycolicibacterium litorale]
MYFVDDRPFTDAARLRAAVWGYGGHAVASGLAAAWWHGLTMFAPDVVEVTMPRNGSGRSRPGSKLRRRDLESADIDVQRGLRVTAVPLTVIEAAVRIRGGAKIMDRALQNNMELRQLWHAHLRNKGRYGSPAARILLQAADTGAHSEAERLFIRLTFHSESGDFHHDRVRQNAITLLGWQVLRFTWLDLTEYPERVIATLRTVISV